MARMRSAMKTNAPLSTPTSTGDRARVVPADGLPELAHAGRDLVAEIRMRPAPVHRSARLARRAAPSPVASLRSTAYLGVTNVGSERCARIRSAAETASSRDR